MLYALSHEYTHFIRDMSVDAFNKLADFAVRELYGRGANVEQLIQDQINKAKANGREISYDEAYEEFVADAMETMLTSEDMAEHLQHLYETDKKLSQKLLNAVKRFYKAFKESYQAYKNLDYKNRTAESYEMLKLSKESYRQIAKLYAECLKVAAGEYNGKFAGTETKNAASEGGDVSHSFRGYAPDGKPIYESNFPKGTPKAAKSQRILEYIQNVWSKKPIRLQLNEDNGSKTIYAQFDPTYDPSENILTDASKIMGGNRHGNSSEQRVTLDLADDYYEIAETSRHNYSKKETGKTSGTHEGVTNWHYFVNDIYFAEYGEKEYAPYRVTINVKEKANGDYVYSFSAEKEDSTALQTLHAAVNRNKVSANGESSMRTIPHRPPKVKTNL